MWGHPCLRVSLHVAREPYSCVIDSSSVAVTDEETGAEGIPFPLPSETSQFLQSFSLLEPPEPTEAGRNTISPAGVPPAHMHTSHSSIGFQPPSHLVPAVSAGAHAVALLPALLLDLQPHDRQSHGQEWHDPSELPLFDSWRAGALHRHAPSWPQPVAMSDSQLPQHSQTARLALGASAAPAATAFPQQLGELQMDLSQLSSGSHSQDGAAEEEQLPFAVSSSSSRDQGVPSRPSSSGASHTSMQRESVSSSRGFSIMMSGEEVVDLPGAVASQADAWVDAAVPAQGSLDAAAHNGIGHLTSAAVVMEPSNLQSTAEVDAPQLQSVSSQLEANPDAGSELSIGVIGSLHLPVSMVASTLQHRATATVQLPPLPLVSDLPSQLQTQLPAVATAALMPGSQTGLLLPGTGADLLDRPGSSPLPVSKLLRMVSEDQASLLSGLAAQCAAPGGLLGPASAGQMLPEPTWASETAPQPAACSPSGQTVSALTGNPSSSAQQAQHAQRVWRRHTSPRLESSASPSQQASLTSSAPGPISADSPAQSAQAQTSPLRKKLSQFFSPMFGSISPQRAEVQQSNLQQPLLLQTASQSPMHKQQQQQQQNEESECAGRACVQHGLAQHSTAQLPDMQPGIPAAWQPPSLHQPASALLAASQSAALTHSALLCFSCCASCLSCCAFCGPSC